MEVQFPPDTEAQLQQFAASNGKDAAQVVKETVTNMLQRHAEFIAGVERGIAASNRGDVVGHEEAKNRINRLFQS